MPTNTLTDSRCKAAKPSDKAFKLFDGGGLFLFVSPTGAKVWRLAYRLDGKQKTISFGAYPDVSLSDARQQRDKVKAVLREGGDPMAPRTIKRAAKMTLGDASTTYWAGRKDVSDDYRQNATRGIDMHLDDLLGKSVGAIARADLLNSLNRLDAAGKHSYVRKIRMWISQVFDWAIEQELAEINPAKLINPERAFGRVEVEHFAALEPSEVKDFMQRLSLEDDRISVLGCKLLALTWVRTAELRMMELHEIDFDKALWTIPADKMKRRKDLIVPLSTQAIAIIKQLLAIRNPAAKYVVASVYRKDRPISENTILYLIHRIGYKGRMTGHGWRSVASTWANESGYSSDAIERQLAHVPDDKVRSTYNRAQYLAERSQMLQDWGDWLDAQS